MWPGLLGHGRSTQSSDKRTNRLANCGVSCGESTDCVCEGPEREQPDSPSVSSNEGMSTKDSEQGKGKSGRSGSMDRSVYNDRPCTQVQLVRALAFAAQDDFVGNLGTVILDQRINATKRRIEGGLFTEVDL